MPAQRTKSKLGTKLSKQTVQGIKDGAARETTYGFEALPPGLKAVAQVTDCGFFEYDKDTKMKQADGKSASGQLMFKMTGVIMEPEYFTHNGIDMKIAGRQIFLTEPIFDTKNGKNEITTQGDHLNVNVLNHMRRVGQNTDGVETPEEIEACAEGIKEGKPFFNFSTSFKAGQKNPDGSIKYEDGVWENWNGNRGLENYNAPDGSGATTDTTTDPDAGTVNEGKADNAVEDQPEDLDALVATAGNTDDPDFETAQARLKELAIANGVDEETVDGAPDWETVKGWIENGPPTAENGPPAAAEPEPDPKKNDVCKYPYAPDAKNPKKVKNVDHNIESVNVKGKTVTLKNLTTNKVVVGKDNKPLQVAWDALLPV